MSFCKEICTFGTDYSLIHSAKCEEIVRGKKTGETIKPYNDQNPHSDCVVFFQSFGFNCEVQEKPNIFNNDKWIKLSYKYLFLYTTTTPIIMMITTKRWNEYTNLSVSDFVATT